MRNTEKDKYDIVLNNKEKERLRVIFKKRFTHPKIRDRIQCAILRDAGHSLVLLAQMLLCTEQHIKDIIKIFLEFGIKGLLKLKYRGDPGDLTSEEKAKLKDYINTENPSTVKQIRCWIEASFNKVFTVSGVTKMLKKLNFRYKKPKLIPGNKERCVVKITKKSIGTLSTEIPIEISLILSNFAGKKYNSKQEFFDKLEASAGKNFIVDYRSIIERHLSISDASEEAQNQFVVHYNEIKTFVGKGVVVLHLDAMHLVHLPKLANCWIEVGKDFIIPTNTGRKRLNILGAYNPDTHKVIVDINETNCCHKRIIEFFKKINAEIDEAIHHIVIVLDNAKYYRNKKVTEFLETSRIILMFTPPYCPNLNLIERFWKFSKKHLVTNTYIKKYEDFKSKVKDFFCNIEEYTDELKSLITENFQIIN